MKSKIKVLLVISIVAIATLATTFVISANNGLFSEKNGMADFLPVIYTDVWSHSAKNIIQTNSTTFVVVPNSTVNIHTLVPTDLIIMGSAESLTSQNARLWVEAKVDGVVAEPGSVNFMTREGNYESHTFNFYMKNVTAGSHTITIYWRMDGGSSDFVRLGTRTLNVIANGAGHIK